MGTLADSRFRRLLKQMSLRSRAKKFALLERVFRPKPDDRILDIGASGDVFLRYTFEDVYPYPQRITGGGLDLREVVSARRHYPQPSYAVFDGCCLPFPDKSFDLVFSNAVIEHIPGRQKQFAKEVMRVGKNWFVTTPNYWYPLETHYHLPFIQFLPRSLQREYNRLLGTHIPRGQIQDLALLSAGQLQRLFPIGRVTRVRVTFWPETLVTYHVEADRIDRGRRDSG